MRSSFRDWCSETGVAREVAEAALAHKVRSQAEAAYAPLGPAGPEARSHAGLGPRISLASVETRRPNRSAEALAHDPLPVMSQLTLWGHASRVPGGAWRGAVPPSTPRRSALRQAMASTPDVDRPGGPGGTRAHPASPGMRRSGRCPRRRAPALSGSRKEIPPGSGARRSRPGGRLPASTMATPAQNLDAVCVRSSTAFPLGICGRERPPGGGGGRVKTRPSPRPSQALGPGVAPLHVRAAQCGTGDRVATNATPSDRTG